MGENGIHDLSMRGSDAVNDGSSTLNVPVDVHARESERSGFGVAKGGQGLGDSFFFFFLDMGEGCVVLCGRMSRRSWDERRQVTTTMIMADRGHVGCSGTIKLHRTTWEHKC